MDISDPVSLLGILFLGGLAPIGPFPDCGTQPEGETLGCEMSTCA